MTALGNLVLLALVYLVIGFGLVFILRLGRAAAPRRPDAVARRC